MAVLKRKEKADEEKEPSDVDLLKIALWFIGRCGNVDRAERVFKAASAAQRELQPELKVSEQP